jgi:hypothetical protein
LENSSSVVCRVFSGAGSAGFMPLLAARTPTLLAMGATDPYAPAPAPMALVGLLPEPSASNALNPP